MASRSLGAIDYLGNGPYVSRPLAPSVSLKKNSGSNKQLPLVAGFSGAYAPPSGHLKYIHRRKAPPVHRGSIKTPGFSTQLGSTADLAARSDSAKGSGLCWSYHGR